MQIDVSLQTSNAGIATIFALVVDLSRFAWTPIPSLVGGAVVLVVAPAITWRLLALAVRSALLAIVDAKDAA